MTIQPLQLAFYKGIGGKHGAIQLNLQKPHYYVRDNPKLKNYEGKFIKEEWKYSNPNLTTDDLTTREGALFLEITSATGKNVYDWENKIVIALSINDMAKMLLVLEGLDPEVKIMHDPGAKTLMAGKIQKYLTISSPQGIKTGTIIRCAQSEAGNDTISHSVPLSADETRLFAICLRNVIPVSLSWT